MEDTDLAYAAGIIDGEGSIGVQRRISKRSVAGVKYTLCIQVGMSDSNVPHWLKDIFGGSTGDYQPKNPSNKRIYHWQIFGTAALEFLSEIMPYMKTKRQHAELAIVFPVSGQKWKRSAETDIQEQLEKLKV